MEKHGKICTVQIIAFLNLKGDPHKAKIQSENKVNISK